jgi:hypothetical protein
MTADDQQITVRFVHPNDSTQVLTATVGQMSTPNYLVKQLINANFLSKPAPGADYRLLDPATGKELPDQGTLAAAGVTPNAMLNVMQSVTGASHGPGAW